MRRVRPQAQEDGGAGEDPAVLSDDEEGAELLLLALTKPAGQAAPAGLLQPGRVGAERCLSPLSLMACPCQGCLALVSRSAGTQASMDGVPLPLGDRPNKGGPANGASAAPNPLGRSLPAYPATIIMVSSRRAGGCL